MKSLERPVVTFRSMGIRAEVLRDDSNAGIKKKCSLRMQVCQNAFLIIVLPSTGLLLSACLLLFLPNIITPPSPSFPTPPPPNYHTPLKSIARINLLFTSAQLQS